MIGKWLLLAPKTVGLQSARVAKVRYVVLVVFEAFTLYATRWQSCDSCWILVFGCCGVQFPVVHAAHSSSIVFDSAGCGIFSFMKELLLLQSPFSSCPKRIKPLPGTWGGRWRRSRALQSLKCFWLLRVQRSMASKPQSDGRAQWLVHKCDVYLLEWPFGRWQAVAYEAWRVCIHLLLCPQQQKDTTHDGNTKVHELDDRDCPLWHREACVVDPVLQPFVAVHNVLPAHWLGNKKRLCARSHASDGDIGSAWGFASGFGVAFGICPNYGITLSHAMAAATAAPRKPWIGGNWKAVSVKSGSLIRVACEQLPFRFNCNCFARFLVCRPL
jgi:hypothetical protein